MSFAAIMQIATFVGVVILVALGSWQTERQYRALLAKIDECLRAFAEKTKFPEKEG